MAGSNRRRSLVSLMILAPATISQLTADEEQLPMTKVTMSSQGTALFEMVAPPRGDKGPPLSMKESYGVAYWVSQDGAMHEAWRVKGWYSWCVFLSNDAHYLVRMGPWSPGRTPTNADLAVAFYRDGELLSQYSTKELVKDPSRVIRSGSHYMWLPDPNFGPWLYTPEAPLQLEDAYRSFRITTVDGWEYTFDLETGKIRTARRVPLSTGGWASPEDMDRLGIALLVVDFPKAYSEIAKELGSDRVRTAAYSENETTTREIWAVTDPASRMGYDAIELTVNNLDYKGGPEGSASGTVTGARLLHFSSTGLSYAFVPSDRLLRLIQKEKIRRPAKMTAAEFASELLRHTNGHTNGMFWLTH